MKKLLVLLMALTLALTSVAAFAEEGGIKLGIVTPDADHGFTGESVAHARAEAEAMKEAGIIEDYMIAVGDEASEQIQGIETILNWGPSVVMLWPLEGEQLRNAAQTVVDEGVPIVIYDRLIENFEGKAAEIMGDNVTIGNMMGQYLLNYYADDLAAGETINYLLFIGDSSTVSVQRTQGMMDVIDASEYAGQFNLLQEGFQTDWSNSTAKEQFENWLSTADAETIADLDLIVTHDDEIVDGIMQVVPEEEGLTDLRLITGVGGRRETLATFDNIEKPELLTYFFSPSYVREALRLAVAVANGDTYQDQEITGQQFLIPTIEIDKNSVEDYRASTEYADRYSIE